MKILYSFPSRERPYKFFNGVDNIIAMARHDNYLIQATLDLNDSTMTSQDVKDKIKSYGDKLTAVWGTSANKIHAINRDIWMQDDWDIVMTFSDDFYIKEPGFDLDVLEHFRNGFSGLLHYPDQVAGDRLCTFPLMDRAYYDLFNFIYQPSFKSVYADNWQHDVAKLLGRYKFVNKPFLEHRHHIHGFGEADELLKRTEHPIVYHQDYMLYEHFKSINYEIEKYQP